MRVHFRLALISLSLVIAPHARATAYIEPLSFTAPSKGIGPVGASGGAGLGPVSFNYSVGASSATAGGEFNGALTVDYSRFMRGPGTTSLGLSFLGDTSGGLLRSDLGGSVKVTASAFGLGLDLLNKNFSLKVDKSYTPSFADSVTGSASYSVVGANNAVGVAQASANFNIVQTDTFKATGIDGVLAYRRLGGGPTQMMPFSIASDGGLKLDVELAQAGVWNFKLVKMTLDNTFSTSFDAQAVLRERNLGCGPLGLDWCAWNSLVAGIDLYDTPAFALDFDRLSGSGGFSIVVRPGSESIPAVPEPGTLLLFAVGTVFIWSFGRFGRRPARTSGSIR